MIKNIEFEYMEGVYVDKSYEKFMIGQCNNWFKEYTERINRSDGIIRLIIHAPNKNNIEFENTSKEFKDELIKHIADHWTV